MLGASRRGRALHPHPVPPVDLTAASSAQHALVPAGAGPPQQPVAEPVCVREFSAFALGLVLVSMLILLAASCMPAAHVGRRQQSTMDAEFPSATPCVLSNDVASV